MTMNRARLDLDHAATGESLLNALLATVPTWLAAATMAEVREFRRIAAHAKSLKGGRRNVQWATSVACADRDMERLRAGIYKRTGN